MVRSASKRRSRNFYMSVVVMDANMPTDYDSCWYLDCKYWKECYINGKSDNCPLRPLPEKYGRLIDGDELYKSFRESIRECRKWIDEMADRQDEYMVSLSRQALTTFVEASLRTKGMPTIVEAEGE